MSPTKVNHFAFIDCLRGWAALGVVAFHMALIPAFQPLPPAVAKQFVMAGGYGVTLFFVISAFTLSYSMRKRAEEPNARARFYVRRVFRIAPLFYAWLVLQVVHDFYYFRTIPPTSVLVIHALFAFNFFPSLHEGIVMASWTLGVEMLFYLMFPIMGVSAPASALQE